MSTIIASNISDGTTSVASTYVVNGSAKAWVNFDGTGTIALRDSFNVASVTDNSTGNYSYNLTANMNDANYCVCTSYESYNSSTQNDGIHLLAVGSIRLYASNPSVASTDNTIVTALAHGDLA